MPNNDIENAQRLIAANRAVRKKFDRYVEEVRDEILLARMTNNTARADMLEAGLK